MNDVTIVKYSHTILTVCYALRLHVVEMKALFCRLFPLYQACRGLRMDRWTNHRGRKLTPYLDVLRIHQLR